MARIRTLLLVAFSLIFILFAYASDAARPVAKEAVLTEQVWDFGRIKQGEKASKEFLLKNDTGQILHIKSITTSCGCTASKAKDSTVLPGGATTVGVTFNSAGYLGEVTQYVYVHTDNVKNSILKFTVKIEVTPK